MLHTDSCNNLLTHWDPRPDVLADVEHRWPGRDATWDTRGLGRDLAVHGFAPHAQLPGGRFGVVVAGMWRGRPSVAKLDANPGCEPSFGSAVVLAGAVFSPRVSYADPRSGVIVLDLVVPDSDRWAPGTTDPVELGEMLRLLGRAALRPLTGTTDVAAFIAPRISGSLLIDVDRGSPVSTAAQLAGAQELLRQMPVGHNLIHGDVSAGNVLSGRGRWWLVDQRGMTGDPQFDVAIAAYKFRFGAEDRAALIRAAGADTATVDAWERIARVARL